MKKSPKTLELKFERTIPAPPSEVYDAWLNPKIKGNPWNMADKLLFNPKVDGFFYWLVHGTPHYGRFTKIERPRRIQHRSLCRHLRCQPAWKYRFAPPWLAPRWR